MPTCTSLGIGLLLAISGYSPAYGQATTLGTIYHADNQNGSVLILAENHGFVPYTALLRAKLTRMHCSDTLPSRFVVFPSKQPHVLTTITYDPAGSHNLEYYYTSQFGIYTGHAPDSSYVYALPFQKGSAVEQHFFNEWHKRKMHHHYFFNLPENMPVRAAREGIVANFRQDLSTTKGGDSNYIVIFHEDGTYAEYTNFNQNSAVVQLGQRVVAGDILCYASGLNRHWFRFCVQSPGTSEALEVPVIFSTNK